jgi:LacI family transcriptional regulator
MAVTMAELAKHAGVCHSTISLVLNGKAGVRVSESKRKFILDLAEKLNYRPNMAAKVLRNRKQYTIGIIMPALNNRFYGEAAALIQHKLTKKGYLGIFAFWETAEEVKKAYDTILSRGVDGVITWEYNECLAKEKVPAVIYDNHIAGYDCIRLDYEYFSREAVAYLAGLGHRRIGYIGGKLDLRYKYYVETLKANGLEFNPKWTFDCECMLAGGAKGLEHIRTEAVPVPTAIITQNDIIAMGAMYTAVTGGLRVPEDISFIGCDDIPEAAYYLPPLTTFANKLDLLAEKLVDIMLQRLDSPESELQKVTIRPELIIRKSCSKIIK